MNQVFADTSFLLALCNLHDRHHEEAQRVSVEVWSRVVLTDYVLLELANGLARATDKPVFTRLLSRIRGSGRFKVVHVSEELREQGLRAYSRYADKDWSLTDCISFLVMREKGIRRALTFDAHFRQAGFTVLP